MPDSLAVNESAMLAGTPVTAAGARARLVRRILKNRNVVIGGSVFLLLVLVASANNATSTSKRNTLPPMTTLRFFRIRRTNRARAPAAVTGVPASIALSFTARLSGIADARIDVGVHDVHHEIDQHVGGGREQHDPLYDR